MKNACDYDDDGARDGAASHDNDQHGGCSPDDDDE